MSERRPFIVILPGASQNPAHYGYLSHLLQLEGYPVLCALLPSVGVASKVTVEDDVNYVRNNMLIPVLDHEARDAIMVMHSYSSVPGSAAAHGFGKAERAAQGKTTGVIGQINYAAILAKGGDGNDILSAFGGHWPPHIRTEPEANLCRCDDPIPPLYPDVSAGLAKAVAVSSMAQCMTSMTSPCPRATWDSDEYRGRVAFIRTLNDAAIPLAVQQMMLDNTGVDWIIKDIESGHSPQLSHPEEMTAILVKLAKGLELL